MTKSHRSLALERYVAISPPANAREDVKAALPDHLACQAGLERGGALDFAAGDPIHISDARTYVMPRWMINEGSLALIGGLLTKCRDDIRGGYDEHYD